MRKYLLFVEDGSVDLDKVEKIEGLEVIVYRQGGALPILTSIEVNEIDANSDKNEK